jgi:hypothetical protein
VLCVLAKAWTTTMIATTLSLTGLALSRVWDPETHVRVVLSLDWFGRSLLEGNGRYVNSAAVMSSRVACFSCNRGWGLSWSLTTRLSLGLFLEIFSDCETPHTFPVHRGCSITRIGSQWFHHLSC